jgi:hypothetical protein
MLQFLNDMHRFHLDQAQVFDAQRLGILQVIIAAIALLATFLASRDNPKRFVRPFQGTVIAATVLALAVQLYWNQYARDSESWARKYFNEIVDLKSNDPLPSSLIGDVLCCDADTDVLGRVNWRVRKSNEIRDAWLGTSEAEITVGRPDNQQKIPVCRSLKHWTDVFGSSRQYYNIWFVMLLALGGAGTVFANVLLTGERRKPPEKPVL